MYAEHINTLMHARTQTHTHAHTHSHTRFGGSPHYGAGEDSVKADSLVINCLHRPRLS
jgi:hypothetical protein